MDKKAKKEYLVILLKQSEIPKKKINPISMLYEKVDLEQIADFLLDNGVDINIGPYLYKISSGLCYVDSGKPVLDDDLDLDSLFDEVENGRIPTSKNR